VCVGKKMVKIRSVGAGRWEQVFRYARRLHDPTDEGGGPRFLAVVAR